jgi:hypothetical protein
MCKIHVSVSDRDAQEPVIGALSAASAASATLASLDGAPSATGTPPSSVGGGAGSGWMPSNVPQPARTTTMTMAPAAMTDALRMPRRA